MLSPYSRRYHLWMRLINLIDATYTAFLIPIIVAFIGRSSDGVKDVTTVIEIVFGDSAGCIILLDVFVNLHVGFVTCYDYKKKVVMDGKHVLWYYLKYGGAWIDILSVIPVFFEIYVVIFLGFGSQSEDVAVLRLFRLLRIYRILKTIYGSSFSRSTAEVFGLKLPSGIVYLLSVIYSMLVMMNFLGCLLYYIADWEDENLDGTWVFKYLAATRDIPNDVTDTNAYVLELIRNHTQPELYLTSLYWAVTTVTTVGYGDITPNSFTEMIALIVVMLSHIMLFGLLIGSISELVKNSLKSAQFKEKVKQKTEIIGRWMQHRKLPHSVVKKINSYHTEIQRQSTDFDEEEILDELPLSLRTEVICHLTKSGSPVFSNISQTTLKKVAGRLIPVTLPPGRELLRQGDVADALYILEQGKMSVLFNEVVVYAIEGPETCAETGILSNFIPRLTSLRLLLLPLTGLFSRHYPITLRAFTSCTLWKLHSKDLKPVFALDPQLRDALTEGYRQRLLKSFGMSLRTRGLEKRVEAEFGSRMSNLQAVQLRGLIGRTTVHDGSFRALVENVVSDSETPSHVRISADPGNSRNECIGEDLSPRTRAIGNNSERSPEEKKSLLEIADRIRLGGEFGLVRLVGQLRKAADSSGSIGQFTHGYLAFSGRCVDLDGLRRVTDHLGAPLRPRMLLLLFSLYDPLETDRINIFSVIDELRELEDFSPREVHVNHLFNSLSSQEKSGDVMLTLAGLMRNFRVENHPEVIAGSHSTVTILNDIVSAISHEDITRADFLNFHRDLGFCVEEDERFIELTNVLWTTAAKAGEDD